MSENIPTKRQKRRKKIKIIKMIVFFIIFMMASLTITKNLKMSEQDNNEEISDITETNNLKINNEEEADFIVEKATLNYIEKSNQTILSLDIKNNGKKVEDKEVKVAFYGEGNETLDETTAIVKSLDMGMKTRINLVIEKDLRKSIEIKIR